MSYSLEEISRSMKVMKFIPSYHSRTKASVALTNAQVKEELHHEQTVLAQAGQGKGMNCRS